ncbi:MAG: N-acetyltransferase [Clostridiales bacterium]|jgi:predicted N-acetyltransferase YhbS|nr:N-acetyltransferase [Clostridiales bacterium]
MPKITIRNEVEEDFSIVEEITRRAFYNQHVPGCNEHYLVHVMRSHEDFLPELEFVMEVDDKLIGNIMYTKAMLVDESGKEKQILTFGPVCILPEHQRVGYGKKLMQHSFKQAVNLDYDAIVIFGDPDNYVGLGFVSCQKHNICLETGQFPVAMLVKELKPGIFDGRKWIYYDSPVMQIDEEAAKRFDDSQAPLEKKWMPSQEEFYIFSHSFVQAKENSEGAR